MMRIFAGRVVVVGREHIPDSNAVFVFNHQSQLDIMSAYSLGRQFSWISKDVLGLVPGIGTLMWIAGDILIARKQKGSIGDMFKKVEEKLSDGDSDIFIFPQGTRQRSGSLPFKHGAFTMSLNSSKPIVPVTCDIAPGVWGRSFAEVLSGPPAVTLTVHPVIAANSGTKEELTKRAYDAVYSCLKAGSKAHSD
jgi:1-acyl-sn-glycerol-3-phosphate acyltransferase